MLEEAVVSVGDIYFSVDNFLIKRLIPRLKYDLSTDWFCLERSFATAATNKPLL